MRTTANWQTNLKQEVLFLGAASGVRCGSNTMVRPLPLLIYWSEEIDAVVLHAGQALSALSRKDFIPLSWKWGVPGWFRSLPVQQPLAETSPTQNVEYIPRAGFSSLLPVTTGCPGCYLQAVQAEATPSYFNKQCNVKMNWKVEKGTQVFWE